MANSRRSAEGPVESRRRLATTPEGQENHLIAMAVSAVERRMKEGTASAQELVHFLKLGSSRERLEQQRLSYENELTKVKIDALAAQERTEAMYKQALSAMRGYSGMDEPDDEFED